MYVIDVNDVLKDLNERINNCEQRLCELEQRIKSTRDIRNSTIYLINDIMEIEALNKLSIQLQSLKYAVDNSFIKVSS